MKKLMLLACLIALPGFFIEAAPRHSRPAHKQPSGDLLQRNLANVNNQSGEVLVSRASGILRAYNDLVRAGASSLANSLLSQTRVNVRGRGQVSLSPGLLEDAINRRGPFAPEIPHKAPIVDTAQEQERFYHEQSQRLLQGMDAIRHRLTLTGAAGIDNATKSQLDIQLDELNNQFQQHKQHIALPFQNTYEAFGPQIEALRNSIQIANDTWLLHQNFAAFKTDFGNRIDTLDAEYKRIVKDDMVSSQQAVALENTVTELRGIHERALNEYSTKGLQTTELQDLFTRLQSIADTIASAALRGRNFEHYQEIAGNFRTVYQHLKETFDRALPEELKNNAETYLLDMQQVWNEFNRQQALLANPYNQQFSNQFRADLENLNGKIITATISQQESTLYNREVEQLSRFYQTVDTALRDLYPQGIFTYNKDRANRVTAAHEAYQTAYRNAEQKIRTQLPSLFSNFNAEFAALQSSLTVRIQKFTEDVRNYLEQERVENTIMPLISALSQKIENYVRQNLIKNVQLQEIKREYGEIENVITAAHLPPAQVESLRQRLTTVQTQMASFEGRVNARQQLTEKFRNLVSPIATIEGELSKQTPTNFLSHDRINQIDQEYKTLETRYTADVASIDTAYRTEFEALGQRLGTIKTQLDAAQNYYHQVGLLQGALARESAKFTTITDRQQIHDMQIAIAQLKQSYTTAHASLVPLYRTAFHSQFAAINALDDQLIAKRNSLDQDSQPTIVSRPEPDQRDTAYADATKTMNALLHALQEMMPAQDSALLPDQKQALNNKWQELQARYVDLRDALVEPYKARFIQNYGVGVVRLSHDINAIREIDVAQESFAGAQQTMNDLLDNLVLHIPRQGTAILPEQKQRILAEWDTVQGTYTRLRDNLQEPQKSQFRQLYDERVMTLQRSVAAIKEKDLKQESLRGAEDAMNGLLDALNSQLKTIKGEDLSPEDYGALYQKLGTIQRTYNQLKDSFSEPQKTQFIEKFESQIRDIQKKVSSLVPQKVREEDRVMIQDFYDIFVKSNDNKGVLTIGASGNNLTEDIVRRVNKYQGLQIAIDSIRYAGKTNIFNKHYSFNDSLNAFKTLYCTCTMLEDSVCTTTAECINDIKAIKIKLLQGMQYTYFYRTNNELRQNLSETEKRYLNFIVKRLKDLTSSDVSLFSRLTTYPLQQYNDVTCDPATPLISLLPVSKKPAAGKRELTSSNVDIYDLYNALVTRGFNANLLQSFKFALMAPLQLALQSISEDKSIEPLIDIYCTVDGLNTTNTNAITRLYLVKLVILNELVKVPKSKYLYYSEDMKQLLPVLENSLNDDLQNLNKMNQIVPAEENKVYPLDAQWVFITALKNAEWLRAKGVHNELAGTFNLRYCTQLQKPKHLMAQNLIKQIEIFNDPVPVAVRANAIDVLKAINKEMNDDPEMKNRLSEAYTLLLGRLNKGVNELIAQLKEHVKNNLVNPANSEVISLNHEVATTLNAYKNWTAGSSTYQELLDLNQKFNDAQTYYLSGYRPLDTYTAQELSLATPLLFKLFVDEDVLNTQNELTKEETHRLSLLGIKNLVDNARTALLASTKYTAFKTLYCQIYRLRSMCSECSEVNSLKLIQYLIASYLAKVLRDQTAWISGGEAQLAGLTVTTHTQLEKDITIPDKYSSYRNITNQFITRRFFVPDTIGIGLSAYCPSGYEDYAQILLKQSDITPELRSKAWALIDYLQRDTNTYAPLIEKLNDKFVPTSFERYPIDEFAQRLFDYLMKPVRDQLTGIRLFGSTYYNEFKNLNERSFYGQNIIPNDLETFYCRIETFLQPCADQPCKNNADAALLALSYDYLNNFKSADKLKNKELLIKLWKTVFQLNTRVESTSETISLKQNVDSLLKYFNDSYIATPAFARAAVGITGLCSTRHIVEKDLTDEDNFIEVLNDIFVRHGGIFALPQDSDIQREIVRAKTIWPIIGRFATWGEMSKQDKIALLKDTYCTIYSERTRLGDKVNALQIVVVGELIKALGNRTDWDIADKRLGGYIVNEIANPLYRTSTSDYTRVIDNFRNLAPYYALNIQSGIGLSVYCPGGISEYGTNLMTNKSEENYDKIYYLILSLKNVPKNEKFVSRLTTFYNDRLINVSKLLTLFNTKNVLEKTVSLNESDIKTLSFDDFYRNVTNIRDNTAMADSLISLYCILNRQKERRGCDANCQLKIEALQAYFVSRLIQYISNIVKADDEKAKPKKDIIQMAPVQKDMTPLLWDRLSSAFITYNTLKPQENGYFAPIKKPANLTNLLRYQDKSEITKDAAPLDTLCN